jgi:hypothetical protein
MSRGTPSTVRIAFAGALHFGPRPLAGARFDWLLPSHGLKKRFDGVTCGRISRHFNGRDHADRRGLLFTHTLRETRSAVQELPPVSSEGLHELIEVVWSGERIDDRDAKRTHTRVLGRHDVELT